MSVTFKKDDNSSGSLSHEGIDSQKIGSLNGLKVVPSKAKILFIALLIIGGAGVAVASGFGIAQLGHHMHWWTLAHPLSLRDLILAGAGGGLGALLMAGGGIGLYRHGKKDIAEDTEGATLLLGNFKVEKVSPDQFQKIANETVDWANSALRKFDKEKANGDPATYAILQESYEVIKCIQNELVNAQNGVHDNWDSVLVCRDENGKMQAIALYKEERRNNSLAYIATHPDNLRHECNNQVADRVEGSGTCVMLALIKQAQENRKAIKLNAKRGGEAFFNKFGFKRSKKKEEGDDIKMKLSYSEIMRCMNNCADTPYALLNQPEQI
jgi:hypothetical protein